MESKNTPKRAVFRYRVRYERDEAAIIEQYLASIQSEHVKYYFIHTIPLNYLSKMYTILDLHHVKNPNVENDDISYNVFLVTKEGDLYVPLPSVRIITKQHVSVFQKLEDNASELTSTRCRGLYWGTDRRQFDELPGVSALHTGHSPGTFVSCTSRLRGRSGCSPLAGTQTARRGRAFAAAHRRYSCRV
jgi:hypothetical protein